MAFKGWTNIVLEEYFHIAAVFCHRKFKDQENHVIARIDTYVVGDSIFLRYLN